MAQDVHQEFRRLAVGHAQFVAAVIEEAPLLVRVPFLGGDPAAALWAEAQRF